MEKLWIQPVQWPGRTILQCRRLYHDALMQEPLLSNGLLINVTSSRSFIQPDTSNLELEWTLGRRGQEKVKGFISTPSSLSFPSFWPSLTPLSTNLFLSPTFRCSKNQRWQLYNFSRREWYTSNHSPKSRLRRLREHLFYRPLSVADRKGIETRGLGAGTQQHPPLQTSGFFL